VERVRVIVASKVTVEELPSGGAGERKSSLPRNPGLDESVLGIGGGGGGVGRKLKTLSKDNQVWWITLILRLRHSGLSTF